MVEPLGPPPPDWSKDCREIWSELADLLPANIAGKCDRVAFELLCRLVAQMRAGPESFSAAVATQVRMACNEFGMTPASRSKVTAVKSAEPNPFAKL